MYGRAVLVLAGGKAARFQMLNQPWQDKALALIKGKPLLVKAIENVQGVVDEVAVCVNNEERKTQYSKVLKQHNLEGVKFVVDQINCPVKGPALAIMSGLHAVSSAQCLTLPVDMPFLKAEIADYMFAASKESDVTIPMWPNGALETLVMVLNRQNAIEIADTICILNKPRANNIARGANKLLLVSPMQQIRTLDPQLESFRNINTQADLNNLPARSTEGMVKENQYIDRGHQFSSDISRLQEGAKLLLKSNLTEAQRLFEECQNSFKAQNRHFWAALSAEKRAEALKGMKKQFSSHANEVCKQAGDSYEAEAKEYLAVGCMRLAECAIADKEYCQKQVAN
jgi:molybdopterin-guanine dinucleotide biosynthesis protein A